MLTIKLPDEVSQRYAIMPAIGTQDCPSHVLSFAVRIRRKTHHSNPLEFALISQHDALELLMQGGSLAFWKGGIGTKTAVYFKLQGKPQASVAVGRWLLDCRVQETCSTVDRNPLNLLRSNLKLTPNYHCKASGREATQSRLIACKKLTATPIVWSEYLVPPEAIDLRTFTYEERPLH